MNKNARLIPLALVVLTTLTVSRAGADPYPHDRRGLILGFNLAAGGSEVEYRRGGETFTSEEHPGGLVGLRFGYGFSDQFTLTLDLAGYGLDDDGWQYAMASTILMATYHPGGGGFFVRAGFGGAELETRLPSDANDPLAVAMKKNGGAVAFGLGYEWRVGRTFGLGLAFDVRGGEIDDFADVKEIAWGHGAAGVQFNWYL